MSSLVVRHRSGASVTSVLRPYSKGQSAKAPGLCTPRQFHSDIQRQGQAGLAPAPVEEDYSSSFTETGRTIPENSTQKSRLQTEPHRIFEKPLDYHRGSTQSFPLRQVSKRVVESEDTSGTSALTASIPLYHCSSKFDRLPYWKKIPRWKDVSEKQFLNYSWGLAKNIQGKPALLKFLQEVLPEKIPPSELHQGIETPDAFIEDVIEGINAAPMSIRLTPHILSCIDWEDPLNDPLRRQFIPMMSTIQPDHPKLCLDSLHEKEDSPCEGLVHRYTDKCLFLAISHCPFYCRYCTRSYAVGGNTASVTKASLKPKRERWQDMLQYITATPIIQDVVISGGDAYSLQPEHLRFIGERLLAIPHIRRFRVATKGLCVTPSRTLDSTDDWTQTLIDLVNAGRKLGKHVALHTHFCHPNEFSWVSREAAQRLFSAGVTVRNQSVLLRGVNDDVNTMSALIRELADCNIQPYYVYQHDMVSGLEDLRTPLSTILELEQQIRGSIAGFMTPQFVVDLPGGGGKRLASSYKSYNRKTGRSTFVAPAVKGQGKGNGERVYEYWDPLASLVEGWEEVRRV